MRLTLVEPTPTPTSSPTATATATNTPTPTAPPIPTATATPTDPYEPNDSYAQAYSFTSGQVANGRIHSAADNDYFKVFVGQANSTLSASLSGLPANYDLYLARPDQTVAAVSANAGTASESLSYAVGATTGYYYLIVLNPTGEFSDLTYTLQVAVTGPATATATATSTATPTPTVTPTPTRTSTPTATGTSTPTATGAATPTPTAPSTLTPTATATPGATATATATPAPGLAPVITSISPTAGPGWGGTLAILSGSNFQGGATVTFDARAATEVSVSSAMSLTARTPAHSRAVGDVNGNGSVTSLDALCILRNVAALPETTACPANKLTSTVDVAVANPDGQSGMLAAGFTYQHADVNGSGTVTSLDALCTLRMVAALPATTACPAPPAVSPGADGSGNGLLSTDSGNRLNGLERIW